MATSAIGDDRQTGSAMECYPDAIFVRDNNKFYLGNGGDFSMMYDEATDDVAKFGGADIRLSDAQQLQFGNGADGYIYESDSKAMCKGAWDMSQADSLALRVPAVRVDSMAISYSDAWDGEDSDTTVTVVLSDINIPAYAMVLGVDVDVTAAYDGGSISAAALTVGSVSDADAYTATDTLDINTKDRVGATSLAGHASYALSDMEAYCEFALTGGVKSDLSAGSMTINVYYMATA